MFLASLIFGQLIKELINVIIVQNVLYINPVIKVYKPNAYKAVLREFVFYWWFVKKKIFLLKYIFLKDELWFYFKQNELMYIIILNSLIYIRVRKMLKLAHGAFEEIDIHEQFNRLPGRFKKLINF